MGPEFYEDLRAFCDERLRQTGKNSLASNRADLVLKASWEIEGADGLVHDQLDAFAENLPLRALLRRIKVLAGVQMDAIDDDEQTLQAIEERLEA